jgi:hypothetical protein
MKKQLLGIFLFGSLFIGTIQGQGRPNAYKIDVSGYAPTRFNMDVTTEAQCDAINKEHHDFMIKRDPDYDVKRNEYESMIQSYLSHKGAERNQSTVVTLPVVIHIVWNATNAAGNISDAQAISQITVLNQDYGRTNPDTANTPAVWKGRAANLNIQFHLAQRTPAGAPTNGIERRQNNAVTSWTTNDAVKKASTGGLDAWDPTQYLNIWVCDLGGGLLGYGEFPTSSVSQTYGVVILNSAFGNTGTVTSPYQLGRTTTHEFSHMFNLYHIWGDDNGACSGSDLCTDTPNQANSTNNCPAFPSVDACANSPAPNAGDPVNGIMFMNYMDYSYDNCMNMFTQNQSSRSNAVLAVAPYSSLTTSNGATPVNLLSNDAGISSAIAPSSTLCNPTFTPSVVLKNYGSNALTSCSIKYSFDWGGIVTYNWSGNLASLATTTVALPSVTSANGYHTIIIWTSTPNGGVDPQNSNDTIRTPFAIASKGIALPFAQGFESSTFIPQGWSLNNPDGGTTWARSTAAFKSGGGSAYMDNFNYTAGAGQIDEMVSHGFDLTTNSAPFLTFQVAYTYYNQTNPTPQLSTDTLQVLISQDCGSTWTSIYKKGGAQLATATPTPNTNTNFTPTASQWRSEQVSLAAYNTYKNAIFNFRSISGYGDDLYVDDINVGSATGIKEVLLNDALNVYPNPSNGQLSIKLDLPLAGHFVIRIYDVLGRTITSVEEQNSFGGLYPVNLSQNRNGVYFVEVISDMGSITRKIILNRE